MFGLNLVHAYELIFFGLIAITTIFLWWKRKEHQFFWTDFKYAFPVLGTISRAIRRKNINKDESKDGLTTSESNLLTAYSNHINAIDRTRFNNAYTFLLLAKQADRTLRPAWVPAVVFILVILEAAGFSFLLAPFIAAEITANESEIVGAGIALVLAIIAAWLTHWAGTDLYERNLINKMRRVADDQKVKIYKKQIKNDEYQNIDHQENDATRFGNRLLGSSMDRGPKWGIIAAVSYIILIAVISTGLRIENLHLGITKQSADQSAGPSGGFNPFSSMGTSANQSLPPAVQQSAQAARKKVRAEEAGERFIGGIAGISGLGVIFVFTQLFSMLSGFRYGLSKNKRVQDAYCYGTMGFSSYDDYERYELDPKIRRTEMRLQKLRDGLFHDSSESPSSITFAEWLAKDMAHRRAKNDAVKTEAAKMEAAEKPIIDRKYLVTPGASDGLAGSGYAAAQPGAELSNQSAVNQSVNQNPVATFNPGELAKQALNIEDSALRRKFIDDRALTHEQMDQLKAAIFAEKSRRKAEAEKLAAPDTSWMDEL